MSHIGIGEPYSLSKSSGGSLEPSILMYESTNTYSSVLRNKKYVIVYRKEIECYTMFVKKTPTYKVVIFYNEF